MRALSEIRSIVDACSQYYDFSCAASCVEMVLKLENQCALTYRVLQDAQQNTKSGFEPFRGRRMFDLLFDETGFEGAFPGLFSLLNSELSAERLPIITLVSQVDHAHRLILLHEYVVVAKDQDDFVALSKGGCGTLTDRVLQNLRDHKAPHTHVLCYSKLPTMSGRC
jgi:hypothetical protein